MPSPSIVLETVTKRFTPRGAPAVDHLSLSIFPGSVIGLLGENGAGKSTTLNMIATLLRPSEGHIRLLGYDVARRPMEVRRSVGILFGSQGSLYGRLTGRENIIYFASVYGMSSPQATRRAEELIALFGMAEYADRRVSTYSTGMKQRASLARSVVHDPPVLLLDEPTAGLDLSAAMVVHDFVRRWAESGNTVLFSSHHLDEILALCDRALVLHRGRLSMDRLLNREDAADLSEFRRSFVGLVRDGEVPV